ncbi:MAG: hypothetical protein COT71_03675 [Candidatus Andersenbacteria bacterium CG10_big_fil_rev_8_21_14_0_10_54_11]|uniref:Glycosyltransferase RgtA/B/C/D-like domain-containing protein n=1 Tax=Candidatus Andersenbacteria bacterium CG10_big_fil_rev_8_21_14_0_10_54_11 TaxID=1974485 RepID=A0A2M6WYQ5_9BACT|nr:MAG: hypothetical protein COT71_03675 [Candidatus Andersenbacteria bacterium CG10_big_fil_rev_8_21_14_0_10_54_11]
MERQALLAGLALLSIVLLAAGFRFYDLRVYPPGLFPDEAANGEDALLILHGDWRPFYPRGNGREALFFYLDALSVKFFGRGVWQLHVPPAAVGTMTVFAMFFAVRPYFGRLAGLMAAGLLATNHWHVTLSHTGFRAIMVPLFVAMFTALAGYTVLAVKRQRRTASYVYAALAGAALAGGFYTYIAYRVMIGVIAGMAVFLVLDDILIGRSVRIVPHVARYWRHVLVAAAAGLAVLLPLLQYFSQHPAEIVGRAGQVSIFNPDLQREYGGGTAAGTLRYAVQETLRSFFAGSGDLNWRHNVAGFPLLNPITALLFLLGFFWALAGFGTVARKISQRKEVHLGMVYLYVLLLLGGMLLPVVTTAEGLPHGLRSIGLVIPIFMLAGCAAAAALHWAAARRKQWARGAAYGTAAGLLLLGAAYDATLYFVVARHDPAAHAAYRADLPVVASYIAAVVQEHPDAPRPYLVLDEFSVQTIHFLLSVAAHGHTDHPDAAQHLYRLLDPARSHEKAAGSDELLIFTQSTLPDADRYVLVHPEAIVAERRFNSFGEEIMRVVRGAGQVEGVQDGNEQPSFDLDA